MLKCVSILCVCVSWISLGFSQRVTNMGSYGVTNQLYDNAAVLASVYTSSNNLETVQLPAGMNVQEALLFCQYRCLLRSQCASFVFVKTGTTCYLTSFNRCASPSVLLYSAPGMQTYDVRPGTLSKPISTCYSACTGTCQACGKPSCSGVTCNDCAHACWNYQVYNITGSPTLWMDLQLSQTVIPLCNKGWQLIWGYANNFLVYPLLFSAPMVLRLAIIYKDSTVRYSYFNSFTYQAPYTIAVGAFLGGQAGNYWQAPFNNVTMLYHSSCPLFYPTVNTTCIPGSGLNSSFVWLTGSSALDANDSATNNTVSGVQLWIIPKGMEWFDSKFVSVNATAGNVTTG